MISSKRYLPAFVAAALILTATAAVAADKLTLYCSPQIE